MVMKRLSILVPRYNEPFEVIRPLLDSINIQEGIDFKDIEVIIVNDGDVNVFDESLFTPYRYDIRYFVKPNGGVSAARNYALDQSEAEYVIWCDCDDCFCSSIGLWFIFTQMNLEGGFKALYSAFFEESRTPEKEVFYITREDGFQFVHSKFFNRQFLIDNEIRFFEDCTIHEDHALNTMVSACTPEIKWNPTPIYLWKWRDESVCRKDPLYIKKTYPDLMKTSTHNVEWLMKHNHQDKAQEVVVSMTYDAYYTFCHPSWKEIGTKEYRDKAERKFSEYFRTFELLWNTAPDQLKMMVSNSIRQRVVMEGMEMETETLKQFLDRVKSQK